LPNSEITLNRFDVVRQLGSGGMGVVYEAYDHEIDSVVALKMLQTVDGDGIFQFKKEFRALADIQHPNLVRFGELLSDGGQWFFTMELVHGANFLQYVRPDGHDEAAVGADMQLTRTAGRALTHTLELQQPGSRHADNPLALRADHACGYDEGRLRDAASQLAIALHALHQSGRIHRDVKHTNVLVREDGHVVLLDFGLIEELAVLQGQQHRRHIMGTPLFIAPEQIQGGTVGPNVDWYAFGVMLFQSLTGTLPFRGPRDKVLRDKCNFAAPAPRSLVADIPGDLNQLCMELLDRDPERRPQGEAILRRLGVDPNQAVLTTHRTGNTADVFIGRETELAALEEALAQCKAGHGVSVVVQGEPGVGKSALVRRFLGELDAATVVLTGRCYEQEWVPFKGFDTIVDSLSFYLSSLDEELALELVRSGVRFLATIFPVLSRVPVIARRLSGDRAVANPMVVREQAFRELKHLLAAIAHEAPLVLFIDDLQWADKDSLALLHKLLEPPDEPVCLFLATMRPTPNQSEAKTAADQSLPDALSALEELPHEFRMVTLSGLSPEEARRLWESVRTGAGGGSEQADQFRDLLEEAGGHPLFLTELARYAPAGRDGQKLGAHLLEVLWSRVERLDAPARRVMELVAVIGAPLPHPALARAAELDPGECLHVLSGLRAAQMVRMSRRGTMRLVEPYHDRVREAIMQRLDRADSLSSPRVQGLRLQLGRALLAGASTETLPSDVFSIVQQLNPATHLIDAPEERQRLAELNLLAAREAKLATAYDAALDYLDRGLALLDDDPWTSQYELCRELLAEQIQVEYLSGRRELAVQHFSALLDRLQTDAEVTDLYVAKIQLDSFAARFFDATDSVREALARFDVSLPEQPTLARIFSEYAALRWAQGRRPAHELAHLPEVTDPTVQCVMKLISSVLPALYLSDTKLLAVCLIRSVRLSLNHGMNSDSAYALAGYGLILSGALGKFQEAYDFGQLGLRLNRRAGHDRNTPQLLMATGGWLSPLLRPLAEAEVELREGLEAASRHGDIAYEGYLSILIAVNSCHKGSDLVQTQCNAEEVYATARRRQQDEMIGASDAVARYCIALRGLNDEPTTLSRPGAPEPEFREWLVQSLDDSNSVSLFFFYFFKAELAYLFGDYDQAEPLMMEARKRIERVFALPFSSEVLLLEVLLAAQRHRRASWLQRRRIAWSITSWTRKLRAWARSCPENFEAQWLLAAAEEARTRGAHEEAAAMYERTVRAARDYNRPKREALALERMAQLFAERQDSSRATGHALEAMDAYHRWGAAAKAAQIAATWSLDK
jgi:predicted ATPase/serine/threonine protein kinase